MKKLILFASVLSFVLNPHMVVSADPPPADSPQSKVIQLSQAQTSLSLEAKQTRPKFKDVDVPDTCYRSVQHGTRQECSTEYDHQCHTDIKQECRDVAVPVCQTISENVCQTQTFPVCQTVPRNVCDTQTFPVCQNVTENECQNVSVPVCENVPQNVCENHSEQECHDVSVPVCQSVPRNVCDTVQQCTTVTDNVCHGQPPNQVCQSVPRRQCSPVQSCHVVNDSVCHNETKQQCSMVNHPVCHVENRQQCHNVNQQSCHPVTKNVCHNDSRQVCHVVSDSVCHNDSKQVCHIENRQQCHNDYHQECRNVPVQSCVDIPRQVCENVPNMVDEPYACTKTIQVPDGDAIVSDILADVKVVVDNFGEIDSKDDAFTLKLSGKNVIIIANQDPKLAVYQLISKDQQVKEISDIATQVTTVFTLHALSIEKIKALNSVQIIEPRIIDLKVSFKLLGLDPSSLKILSFNQASIKLTMKRLLIGRKEILEEQSIDPGLIQRVEDRFEIDLSKLGVGELKWRKYFLELKVGLKLDLGTFPLLLPANSDAGSLSASPVVQTSVKIHNE